MNELHTRKLCSSVVRLRSNTIFCLSNFYVVFFGNFFTAFNFHLIKFGDKTGLKKIINETIVKNFGKNNFFHCILNTMKQTDQMHNKKTGKLCVLILPVVIVLNQCPSDIEPLGRRHFPIRCQRQNFFLRIT